MLSLSSEPRESRRTGEKEKKQGRKTKHEPFIWLLSTSCRTIFVDNMKEEKATISAKPPPKLSWSAHPVVSTVLWMLGHDTKLSREKAARNEENRSSALSWRDDHGGHIAEYILEIQGKPQDQSGHTENTDLSQQATRLRSSEDQTDAMVAQMRRLGLSSNPGDESPQYTTPSPQWGFYVPITPPETEMYSKANVQQIGKATKS